MGAFDDLIPGNEAPVAAGGNAFGDLVPDEPHGRFFLNLREGWRSSLPGIVQGHVQAGRNLEELANELDLGIKAAQKLGRPDLPEYGESGGPPIGSIFGHPLSRGSIPINPFAGHPVEDAIRMRDAMRAEAARKLTEYQAKRGAEMREYEQSPSFYEEPDFMGQLRGFFEFAGGQILGGAADPTNLIPIGRGANVLRSVGKGFAVNAPAAAGVDVAAQAQEQNLGLRDELDPLRTGLGALAGGAVGGLFNATPHAVQAVRRLFGQPEARALTPEEALPTNFENQIIPADERPLADIIAERTGIDRQRGTPQDAAGRIKQRRADIGEAYRAAEQEGGIMRREDFGEERPRPATDATGTVYTDPVELAAARRERPRAQVEGIEPRVRYAYEREGIDPDSIALAFERARMRAEPEPEVRTLKAQLGDQDVALIGRQMGVTPEELAALGPNSQRRLLARAMEAEREDLARQGRAGAMMGVDVRQQEPGGTGAADYASAPNRPLTREDMGTRIASGPSGRPTPIRDVTATPEQRLEIERMRRAQEAPPSRPPRAPAAEEPLPRPKEVSSAEGLREDAGQVQGRGLERPGGEGQGRQDLEQPAPQQPGRPAQQPGVGVRQGPQADERLSVASKVEGLRAMARNAGWAEKGGRLLREEGAEGRVTGRTTWIPREEWFGAMQRDKGTKMPAGKVADMVERAIRGERLTPQEQRSVRFMLDENDRMESDFLEEGFDAPTPEDLIDNDLVSRARVLAGDKAVDDLPDALEPDAFMAEVRRIVDEAEAKQQPSRDVEAGEPQDRREAQIPEQPAVAERDAGEGRTEPILESYTEADIRTREERVKAAQAEEAKARAGAESKAKADQERDDFTLTGSDRPADANSGQGTLYGGIPLAPIAKGIAQAFGWTGPRASAYAKDVGAWWKSLADAAKDRRGPEGNPVKRFASLVFDSSTGNMRSIAGQYKSKTLDWVIDQFDARAGKSDRATGQTFNDAVDETVNKFARKLSKALGPLADDKSAMSQVAALVRNPQNIRRGTRIGDAAFKVRALLDEALAYMKAAGVDIGEVLRGYYPREFDLSRVMKDVQGFIQALARAYQENGMAAKDATEAAKVLADHVIHGGFDTIFRPDKGNVRSPFVKGRVFGKQVDDPKHPLNRFLVDDPSLNLSLYFTRMARRAETARRFGDGFSKWEELSKKIIDEGGAGALESLKDYIAIGAGLRRQGATQGLRAASVIRTWTTLGLLEKATLSSLQEFLVPAIRSGNWADAARSLRGTLRALTKTAKGQEMRDLAEDLNMIADGIHDTVNAARYSGGEPIGLIESKLMDKFFRRTGLHQWTEASIVGSLDVGRVFIRRMAKRAQAGEKLAKEALVELGVAEKDIAAFSKGLLAANDGLPMAGEIKGAWGDQYRVAMRRFSQQSIMRPHAVDRPKWANTPPGSVVFQLQSYNYAFYENVIKRVARMTTKAVAGKGYSMHERMQLLAPLATLPLLYGVGMGIGEVRDAVLGDPKRKKQEGWQKALKAQSRAVPIAPLDPFINMISQARYSASSSKALAGPALGTLGQAVDTGLAYAFHNSEKTNKTERAAAKAFYDLVIEPGANFALAGFQHGKLALALTAAATQALGSGATREGFVSGVAGPDKKKTKRPAFSY